MKIFVDDYRPAPPGWAHAKTLQEAAQLVFKAIEDQEPIEAVSLDYCIAGGGREIVRLPGPEGGGLVSIGDFYPIAQILAINSVKIRLLTNPAIYLHSDHLDGLRDMHALLSKAFHNVHPIDNIKMYAFYCGHQPESYALLPDPT